VVSRLAACPLYDPQPEDEAFQVATSKLLIETSRRAHEASLAFFSVLHEPSTAFCVPLGMHEIFRPFSVSTLRTLNHASYSDLAPNASVPVRMRDAWKR
jgi:hypothetical protein